MLMRFDFFPLDSETKKSILGMIFSDYEDENESHEQDELEFDSSEKK